MCKSKDAVIASYHWAVLHTPVDTHAMYYVSSLFPLFVSRTFCYGRGERQDCEKKDCKGDHVGVFQWLARLARLARWLAHWPYSITGRSYIWTKNDERISGYADSTNICIRGSYKEIFTIINAKGELKGKSTRSHIWQNTMATNYTWTKTKSL